jgi:hypothetical protein
MNGTQAVSLSLLPLLILPDPGFCSDSAGNIWMYGGFTQVSKQNFPGIRISKYKKHRY